MSPIISDRMVDERTPKFIGSSGRPCVCRCQMARTEHNWLDYFEGEPLFGCLFGNKRCGGSLGFDNAGHWDMMPTMGTTQPDTVDHPGEIDLPCECNPPNCHPSNWSL